jgi:hypothetical protein
VPSSWGGAGGYGLAGEVEVEVRCEVAVVVDGRQLCDRKQEDRQAKLCFLQTRRSLFGRVR